MVCGTREDRITQIPFVSLILPVRNEERLIADCLNVLAKTDYPKERLEIIVVDGESSDRTREIVRTVQAGQYPIPIRLLTNRKRTRGAGLNRGIEVAAGEIIMPADARTVCPPNYISACVETLARTGADNVGGVMRPLMDGGTQEAVGLAMSHPFGVGNAPFRLGNRAGYVESAYLGCFRRDVFDRVGLFDDGLGEDAELNQRICESGGKVYLDPKIEICFTPRDKMSDFWRQYFWYGVSRANCILKHGRPTSLRQLVPTTFVLTVVMLSILSLFEPRLLLGLSAVVGAYVFCDLVVAGSLSVERSKPPLFFRLLVAFPCMHFAWAFGFIWRVAQRFLLGRRASPTIP